MKRFFIDGREVTRLDWEEAFKRFPDASIVLRTNYLPSKYSPPKCEQEPISPLKARELRQKYNN